MILIYFPALLPAQAEGSSLQKGIEAYGAGDYVKAAGHLGAAQSAEFSNPVLHYYLANTLVHLNDREGAIREYRIAYALEPDGDIAKECRLALWVYNADSYGPRSSRGGTSSSVPFGKITFSSDPVIQQAVLTMHKQVDQLTSLYLMPPANYGSGQRASVLRRMYSRPNMQQMQDNARSASAVAESASNLERQLNNKSSGSAVKLDPYGTNLYIRKYVYPEPANQNQPTQTVSGKVINSQPHQSAKE